MINKQARCSGILLHVSSLPGRFGIGDLGSGARQFIDFLHQGGQRLWQVLPLGPTGYGNSPYQSFSAFAANPLFISPELLAKDGLIQPAEVEAVTVERGDRVDFPRVIAGKQKLLQAAYQQFLAGVNGTASDPYEQFCDQNAWWLEDYALFMALKQEFGDGPWSSWPQEFRMGKADILQKWQKKNRTRIGYHKFVQYIFQCQWEQLRNYAAKKDVAIIGDIPIFAALDSCDVWAYPHLFQLDEEKQPQVVAGVPPDYFSKTGQLWGNPLYDWKKHQQQDYHWWTQRIRRCLTFADHIRLDHFRGFQAYWAVPANNKTAEKGTWQPSPGTELFQQVANQLGPLPIIAEDLGVITDEVRQLRDQQGFPGLRVFQFGFNSKEPNEHCPHQYNRHIVAYSGTHDNDTTAGWFAGLSKSLQQYVKDYARTKSCSQQDVVWAIIATVYASVADMAIVPLQDVLALGSETRLNTPGKSADNWEWRCLAEQLSGKAATRLRKLADLYQR